jgi:phosphatidylinositol 3-kinase
VLDKNIQELNCILRDSGNLKKLKEKYGDNDTYNKIWEKLQPKLFYTYKKIPYAFLEIKFPKFKNPVIYEEVEYYFENTNSSLDSSRINFNIKNRQSSIFSEVITFADYDLELKRSDPVQEQSYLVLRDIKEPETLKPTPRDLKELDKILKRPNISEMKPEEKNMIWKFRYYLKSDKNALIKFLRVVKFHMENVAYHKHIFKKYIFS